MIELVAPVILLVCLGMASCDFSYMDFDEGMHWGKGLIVISGVDA